METQLHIGLLVISLILGIAAIAIDGHKLARLSFGLHGISLAAVVAGRTFFEPAYNLAAVLLLPLIFIGGVTVKHLGGKLLPKIKLGSLKFTMPKTNINPRILVIAFLLSIIILGLIGININLSRRVMELERATSGLQVSEADDLVLLSFPCDARISEDASVKVFDKTSTNSNFFLLKEKTVVTVLTTDTSKAWFQIRTIEASPRLGWISTSMVDFRESKCSK